MPGSSMELHERFEDLSTETIDRHRATVSLLEELEAVDWYDQRAEAAADAELKEILIHNRNEEMEHAAMVLEWLRRRNPVVDEQLRTYLFTSGPIIGVESDATGGGEERGESQPEDGSLGIGSLRVKG
jgi:ferritin-like protein